MYEPPKMKAERQEGDSWLGSFLNTYAERHAAILGFVVAYALGMHGLVLIIAVALALNGADKVKNRKAIRELRKEPWYGIGAAFLGYVVKVMGLIQAVGGLI